MSDDLIRRAREALVDVTPGPWRHDGHTGVMASGSVDTYSGPVWATIIRAEQTSEMDGDGRSWETSGDPDANARFIAAARELVPAMVDRLEAQEALLKEALEALEFYGNPDAWKYPPVKVLDGLFTVEYENAASKVKMDRGKQASATLAKLREHLEDKA